MAEGNGGGSGFMGVIIGALLVGVLVLGFFVLNGGVGQQSADISIDVPEVPSAN